MESIILGSYTRKSSEGIYKIILDGDKKELHTLSLLQKEDNPTYLDTTKNGYMYSVSKDGDKGGVAAYQLNNDGTYSFINRVTEEGAPPCYVAVDEERGLVYGANYHKGYLTSYKINNDGSITLADKVQHIGNGPHANQDGPHAHYADLAPDNRLVACDLGNDTLYTYDIVDGGKLTEVATFKTTPGSGPRHIVFHPNNKIAYLFNELSSDIYALEYNSSTGTFNSIQTISTLPKEYSDFNAGAAIRISKDGKHLYASNRGHNSIVSYTVSDSGELTTPQWISVEGDFPRDFNFSNDESFLIVANQNTDNLTLLERNKDSGELTLVQKDIFAPEVVCVK